MYGNHTGFCGSVYWAFNLIRMKGRFRMKARFRIYWIQPHYPCFWSFSTHRLYGSYTGNWVAQGIDPDVVVSAYRRHWLDLIKG